MREEISDAQQGRKPRRVGWLAIAGLLAFALAFAVGCGSSDDDESSSDSSEALTEVGEGEGELNLICWAGYCEDGSADPKVDWVTDFEKETGCQVNAKVAGTSDEMVELMRTRRVRRRLGLRQRDAHAWSRADLVDPGQRRPGAELRDRVRRPQGSVRTTRSTAPTTESRTGAGRTC